MANIIEWDLRDPSLIWQINQLVIKSDASTGVPWASFDSSMGILSEVDASLQNQIDALDVSGISEAEFDSSMGILSLWNANQDTSITALDTLTQLHETSLGNLDTYVDNIETSVGALDTLTQTHTTDITNLETSVGVLDVCVGQLDDAIQAVDLTDVSARIYTNETDIGYLETSVGALDTLTQTHTTEIGNLETSVGVLDISIGQLDIPIQTNTTDITNLETSVGVLDVLTQLHETSLGNIDTYIDNIETSVGTLDTLTQLHETSLGNINTYVDDLEASIGTLDVLTQLHETSLGNLDTYVDNIETSVGTLDTLTQNIETSVGALDTLTQDISANNLWDVQPNYQYGGASGGVFRISPVDTSANIAYFRNVGAFNMDSGGQFDSGEPLYCEVVGSGYFEYIAFKYYPGRIMGDVSTRTYQNESDITDVSTIVSNLSFDDLSDVSVASATSGQVAAWDGTYWVNQDVSTSGVAQSYVDASLSTHEGWIDDVSTRVLNLETSVGNLDTKTQNLDASLDLYSTLNTKFTDIVGAYTVVAGDNNKVIKCNSTGNFTLTFPDSLDTGFQVTVLNANSGTITLDASTLHALDSSTQLQDQYAGASAVHEGSGTWYAFGYLRG